MASKLLTSLFFGSFLIAFAYWNLGDLTIDPFQFHKMQATEFLSSLVVYILFFLAALFGAHTARSVPNFRKRKIKPLRSEALFILQLLLLAILVSELAVTWVVALSEGEGFRISDRQYIDNLSMLKILLLCLLSFGLQKAGLKKTVWCLVNLFAFLLVTLDITREAIIPLVFLVMLTPLRDKKLWLTLGNLIFCVLYSFWGRDGGEVSLFILSIYLGEAINYIFGMCYLHFSDVYSTLTSSSKDHDFDLSIFTASIAPLPGSWVDSQSIDGRNIDAFRPYGAAADLAIWSPIAGFSVFFSFGFVSGLGLGARSKLLRSLAVILTILFFVWLFQYHLRTSFKFIVFFGFLFFFSQRQTAKYEQE